MADVTELCGTARGKDQAAAFWLRRRLLCAAFTLSACGNMGRFETAAPSSATAPAKPNRTVAQTPASEREHERILVLLWRRL